MKGLVFIHNDLKSEFHYDYKKITVTTLAKFGTERKFKARCKNLKGSDSGG